MRLTKRLLAMLLTVVMVLSMLPAIALTASAATLDNSARWTEVTWSQIADGDTIVIANTNNKALPSTTASSSPAKVAITVSGSAGSLTITPGSGTINSLAWDVDVQSGAGSSSMIAKLLQHDSTTVYLRLSATNTNTGLRVAATNSNNTFTMGSGGKLLKLSSAARYVGEYVSGSDWRTYNSETASNYSGQSLKFYKLNASAPAATLSSIALSGSYPTTFTTGDTFSHTGMVVTATYSDSTTADVTSSATWSSPNMSTAGTKTVTVSYTEGGTTKTATYDITVNAPTPATISLSENGTARNPGGTHYAGDSYTLPTTTNAAVPSGYVFMGWSTVTIPTPGSAPTSNYYAKGESVTLAGGTNTFYAVYAQASGTSEVTTWEKVTSAPSDWSGDYVIVNSDYAMTSDFRSGTSGEFKGASVTITDNKVVDPTDKMIWTVAKNGSSAQYSFRNKATGTYANITGTSSTNAALSSSAVWFTIEANTNGTWDVASVSNSARCFSYYATNTSFRTYAKSTNNTGDLYKKTTSGGTSYVNYTTSPVEPSVDTYTLTITQPSNGSISTTDTLIDLVEGDIVTLTANPDTGYEIDEWTITGAADAVESGNDVAIEIGTSDVTATVIFQKINYTITKSAANGTITAAATANYNDSVSFTVAPNSGYQIDSVTVKDASNNDVTVSGSNGSYSFTMPASNVTITAACSLLPTYSYTIYNNGASVGSGTAASVTAPAAPSPSSIQYTDPDTLTTSTFTFAGWGVQSTAITEPGAYNGTLYQAGETIPLSANDTVIRAIYVNGSGGAGFTLSYTYQGTEYFAGAKGSGTYLAASTDSNDAVPFGMEQYNNTEYYYLFYTVNGDKYYLTGTSSSTLNVSNANSVPNSGSFLWKETEDNGLYTYASYNTSGTATGRYLAFNNSTKDRFASYANSYTLTKNSAGSYLTEAGAPYFAVTYHENAGSDTVTNMPSDTSVRQGNSYQIPATIPERDGYRFDGWATSANGSVAYAAASLPATISSVTAAIDLYAKWSVVPQATVTFYEADNTTTFDTQTVYEGVAPTAPASEPTKAPSGVHYYTFAGWSRTAGGSVESPFAVIGSGESTRAYYPVFTENTATFTGSFSGRVKVSTEGSFNTTVLQPALTTTQEGCSTTITGLTILSGENASIATVSTAGNALTVTGVSAGTLNLTVRITHTSGTVDVPVTITVIAGNGGAAGYKLITKANTGSDVSAYDWTGDYIMVGREFGTSEKINTWKVMTFNWTDATTASIGDGSSGNNITTFTLDPANADDFGMAEATTGGVTISALHTGESDYAPAGETTGQGFVFDRIAGFKDGSDNDVTYQYVLKFERVDEVNNYYLIRIKGTNYYLTNSNTNTSGGNSMGGQASPDSIADQLLWKISWASSVKPITASASGDTTATPDVLLIENVYALKSGVSRAIFYNQAGNGFRAYGNGAYTNQINSSTTAGYNVFLYGKKNPFEAQVIYDGTPRNTTDAKITVPWNYATQAGNSSILLEGALEPETFPGWTILNDRIPTWTLIGAYNPNGTTFSSATSISAVSGTENANFNVANWTASDVGKYYVVRVKYQVQDPDGVIHDVGKQAMIVVGPSDNVYTTVIHEASSQSNTGSYTAPARIGSTGVDLDAYVRDNYGTAYTDRAEVNGMLASQPTSWTYTSQKGYTYTISSTGVVTWNTAQVVQDDVVEIKATAGLSSGSENATVSEGSIILYIKQLAYTGEVVATPDDTVTEIPFGDTAFGVTLDNFKDKNEAAPGDSTYSVNAAAEWTWTASTMNGVSVPVTKNSSTGAATIDVTGLATGTQVIVRATNVIATDATTNSHTVVTITGKIFTVGEDNSLAAVNDSFVLDFDRDAKLNVLANDRNAEGATLTLGTAPAGITLTKNSDNSITFAVPGGQLTTATYTFTYMLSKSGETDSTATVTVKPASAIYYEDTNTEFFTYNDGTKGKWSVVGADNAWMQSAIDANDESAIGYDEGSNSLTWSAGVTHKANVGKDTSYGTAGASEAWPSMEFTFVGNAFTLSMMRNNFTGLIAVYVDGAKVKNVATAYGATGGEYDPDADYGGFIYESSDSNYGMPAFCWASSDGTAASHTVKVQVLYSGMYDHNDPKTGNYDVYIDGVTIYNPIAGTTNYKYISFRDTVLATGSLGVPATTTHDYAATLSPASISVGTEHTGTLQVSLTDEGATVYSGYTVAWTSSDTSVATVTAAGSLNTATGVNTATVTGVSEGTATITATITTPGGTTVIRTATVNVTDTVYTVTYILPNGSQAVSYANSSITLGSGVTHLTAAELAEYNAHPYVFRGWAPAAVADTTTQPGGLLDDGMTLTVDGDRTYYAVYTYGTSNEDFQLKTDLTTPLVDGETIVIYETEGAASADKYLLSNADYSSTWNNYRLGVAATPENGFVKTNNTSLYWTVEATSGGFYLKDQNGKYLSATDTDGQLVMVTTPDAKAIWNATTTGVTGANSVYIYNNETSAKYLQHYSGYPEFGAFTYDEAWLNRNEMQIYVQQENNLTYTTDLQSTTVRYTVNYYVDGTAMTSEQIVEGSDPSFPAVTGAYTELAGYSHDYTFLGWIPAAIAEDTTTAPATIYTSGDSYELSGPTAFYAVFTYTGAGSASEGYSLSDSAPEAGDTFIIAAKIDGTYYALNHSRSTTALTITDGAVADTSNVLWKLTAKTHGDYVQKDEETGTDAFKLNTSSTNYNGISDTNGTSNTGAMSFAANGDGFDMYGTYNTGRHLGLSASGSSVQSSAQTLYIFKYSTTGGSQSYYATTLGEAAPITHNYQATITPTSLALHVGDTGSVSATLTDNGATVAGATPTYTTSLASVATVAADGTVTAVANGNATITATYTVGGTDYTATCSVAVTTLATYNVTYYVNGSQYGEVESVTQGDSPSFTAPVYDTSSYNAHAYEFLGWKQGSALSAADTTEAQTLYVAGNTNVISADTNFYAVYRYTDGGALTEAIDLSNGASGQYVIAANVGGTYYAMHNSSFSGKLDRTQIATPGSSISSSDATNYVVTIAKTSDGFTISNGTNLLGYPSSGTDFTTDTHPYWSIATGSHGSYRVTNTNTTNRAITYRAGSTNKFAPYATSNINGTEYYDVEIIPVGDSSSATYYATTLNVAAAHNYVASISPTSVTIEAGQETTAIGTLTDNGITTTAYTPTYTSSNTGVATVSSIGYVDAISAGTANITVSYDVDGTTYSAVCAVTVTPATVVTSYTVSYYVNGSLFETETVAENGHPDFDAPTTDISAYDAHDYTFIGWAPATVAETTTAPTMYTASTASSYTVTGDVTFHAVYTWNEGGSGSGSGSGNYELVSASEATAGSYVIGALRSSSATNAYYFATGTVGSGDMNTTSSSVTVSGTSIAPSSLPTGTMVFTFSGDNSNGFTIATSDGDYLGYTSASNRKLAFASSYSSTKWTVADKSGSLNSKGTYLSCKTGTYTISENSTGTGAIRGYANTTVYRAIYLFKLNSSGSGSGSSGTDYYTTTLAAGTGETATLSVSPATMNLTSGGYGQISVTAANGGAGAYVTATSSNNTVASVTALNDGANSYGVSAGSAGSATITIRYFNSSNTQLASQTVSVTVTAASGTGGTNADYGRVGSDGNAPTTSGNVNAGRRGVVATSISQKAADYYESKGVTWADLTALAGVNSTSSVTAASGNALKSRLQSLMTLSHTVTYSSLTTYWPSTDKSGGSSQNLYIYSNVTSNSSVSREHVWPKSRGQFYESGAGSDLQHLRPEESTVNSTRGNHTMGYVNGVVSGASTKTYGGSTVLWYSGSYSSNNCDGLVEVMDVCKGDVARILLYVYTEYPENTNLFTKTSGGGSGNNASDGNKVIESRDTLLKWCALDPVDTWEMSRNDAVQNIQGNRNVFIDYPELAWMIFNLTPPSTMQTPSGQAAAGNVGTREADTTNYGTSAVGNNSAVMSAEPAPATRGGATRAIGDENSSLPVTGAVMLNGIGEISNNDDVMSYLAKYGAANCLVVPANGSVVFYLTGGGPEAMIAIGASALNGTGTTLKVYQISAVSGSSATGTVLLEQPLATSTEMYYSIKGIAWTGDKSNVLMVRNEGSAPMILTNLRSVAGTVEGHISTGGDDTNGVNAQSATRGITRGGNELQMVIDSSAILAGMAGVQSINDGTFEDETPVDPIDPVDPVASDIVLRGNSISLNGQIDVNFYVDVPDELFDEGVYATLDGERVEFVEGKYGTMVSKKLPAKEMNTKVTLKFYTADGDLLSFKNGASTVTENRYSVQDYLTYVINSNDPERYSDELVKLCKAMSDYGSYTQQTLGFDVENAKAIYLADEIANVTCDGYGYEYTPNTENISFLGASVVTESETAIRVYLSLKGEGITATVDGEPAAIQTNDRGTFVEIANISAKDLGDAHTIVVTNGSETVTISNCSAYSYVQSVLNYAGASDSLKLAVKALKLYGDLAAEYFNK